MSTSSAPTTIITVVEQEGKRLFRFPDGTESEALAAHPYAGQCLTVLREGLALARTREIAIDGNHGACTCFCGLPWPFGFESRVPSSHLVASWFVIGDELRISDTA